MLTIKSPIKLRCRFPMETMHKDLSEKIIGNYTLLNDYVRKEELLYVTTQAPEVYFAEGNNISILNDIKTENRHELRLDVINNLINRILLSGTENFSYQDTVYISNVLRKFGITDVSNFMKQVYKLQEETRENRQLIDVYEEQKNVLMQLFQAESQGQIHDTERKEESQAQVSNQYYIHEEIYNRLHTGKIYEEFKNFTQGIESNTKRIYNTEVAVSEQMSLIQNFNLHNLKKEILNQEEPIYYYHANQYELVENDEVSGEQPEGRVSAAVLLNLVDRIYSLRVNQIEQNSHRWYTVANALFQTAENTWKRYETNHKEGKTVFADMYQTMVSVVHNKQNERNMINHIIEEVCAINTQELEEENVTFGDTVVHRHEQQHVKQDVKNLQQHETQLHTEINTQNLQLQQNEFLQQEQNRTDVKNQYQQTIQNELYAIENQMAELQENIIEGTTQNYHSETIKNQSDSVMHVMQTNKDETNIAVEELQQNQQFVNHETVNIPNHITELMESGALYNEQNQKFETSSHHTDTVVNMMHVEENQIALTEEDTEIQQFWKNETQHLEQNQVEITNQNRNQYENDIEVLHNQFTELQKIQQENRTMQEYHSEMVQNRQDGSSQEVQFQQNETNIKMEQLQQNQQFMNHETTNISNHITELMESGAVYNEQNQNFETNNHYTDTVVNMTHVEENQIALTEEDTEIQQFWKNETQHLEQNQVEITNQNRNQYKNDIEVLHNQFTELQKIQQENRTMQEYHSEMVQNWQDGSSQEVQFQQNETNIKMEQLQQNQQFMNHETTNISNHITELMESGAVYNEQNQNFETNNHYTDTVVNMTHVEQNQNVSEEENQVFQEQQMNQEYVTKQEQLRLQQDLRRSEINQKNLEQFINILNQTTEQPQYDVEQNQYEQITKLQHLEQSQETLEQSYRQEITEETLRQFDEINKKNIENYKKILEIQQQRPRQINASVNKEKARKDALRALDNPDEVLQEIMQTEVTDVHNEMNMQLNEQIYNMFSDETKNIFEQVMLQKTGELPPWRGEADLQHPASEELSEEELEQDTRTLVKETIKGLQIGKMPEEQFAQIQTQVQNIDAKVTHNIEQEEQQRHFHIQNTQAIMNRQNQPIHVDGQTVYQTTELTHMTEDNREEADELLADEMTPAMTELIRQTKEVITKEQHMPQATYRTDVNLNQTVTNEIQNQQTLLQKTENIMNQIVQEHVEELRMMEPTRLTYATEPQAEVEYDGRLSEAVEKEVLQNVGSQQEEKALTMIQKPAITYAMNEVIRNEMHALKNLEISNMYESYLMNGDTGTKADEIQAGSKVQGVDAVPEQLELQHIMKQTELEERIVVPELTRVEERRKAVGLVHKVEEQILTEELINEIKSQTVDNVREETREVNEIHNVNHTQKQINETVNRIQVNQQENIEELVKQNVKKQLNQLTDQVYGKIEKKLQTERKRRGY